ncbi:site-specific integrase [Ruminiclostridium herbifermentans]|uniref:Site-specific integrase n=1 Tax=Ruminiclostridium herbifermentans TaxID=2488810 RepID=A0A4U7J723_9FIRM|nr:site-specific integrase [Ruminiclostridium herbifermentans]QNU67252.1 site-specific integrase [Ruminiclostridium herbifermentans]
MRTVEPIRDIELIRQIANDLKEKNIRDYIMFLFGIYSGLRISDILKLRVKDVRNKEYITLYEQKTGKEKRFLIHPDIKPEIKKYTENMKDYEYLFASRQGTNKPISRARAYDILKEVAKQYNIDSLGTHSMRKTFGFLLYQQTKDIVIVKELFNHSDIGTTLRYIGVIQETKDQAVKKLRILNLTKGKK